MDTNVNRITLQNIARKAMIARGLEPDFPSEVIAELSEITSPAINIPSQTKAIFQLTTILLKVKLPIQRTLDSS
jgi:hypothetical protein